MFCTFCGASIPDGGTFCQQCGKSSSELKTTTRSQPVMDKEKRRLVVIGIFVAVLIFIVIAATNHDPSKDDPLENPSLKSYIQVQSECQDMVKSLMKYPSSFSSSMLGYRPEEEKVFKHNGQAGTVTIDFSVKNSFGMEISGSAQCYTPGNNKVTLRTAVLEDGTTIF